MNKMEVLLAELNSQIKWFDEESRRHKRMHRDLRYASFVLTALSAALASIALAYPDAKTPFTLAIIAASAVAGVVAAVEGVRKPHELWVLERTTYYGLKDLKRLLEYTCCETVDDAVVEDCFTRLQELLGASSEKWNRHVKPSTQDKSLEKSSES